MVVVCFLLLFCVCFFVCFLFVCLFVVVFRGSGQGGPVLFRFYIYINNRIKNLNTVHTWK